MCNSISMMGVVMLICWYVGRMFIRMVVVFIVSSVSVMMVLWLYWLLIWLYSMLLIGWVIKLIVNLLNVVMVFVSGLVLIGKNSLLKMSVVVVLYKKKLYYLRIWLSMVVVMVWCMLFVDCVDWGWVSVFRLEFRVLGFMVGEDMKWWFLFFWCFRSGVSCIDLMCFMIWVFIIVVKFEIKMDDMNLVYVVFVVVCINFCFIWCINCVCWLLFFWLICCV